MLKRPFFVRFNIDSKKLTRRNWATKVHLCKFSEGRRKVQKPKQNRASQTCPSAGTEELAYIFQLP
jgi:hypothetical protein